MSNTIAHRPHVRHHVQLLPVLAVILTVLIATALIWAINRPETATTTTTTEAISAPAAQQAAVAAPESPVFRHAQMRVNMGDGYPRAYVVGLRHLVNGSTLDPVSTQPSTGSYVGPHFPRAGQF
jgi:hypothetical protein